MKVPVSMTRQYLHDFHQIEKHCLYCGTLLKLNKTRDVKRKKFCSRNCQWRYLVREKNLLPPRPTKEARQKAGQTRSRRMALGEIPKPPLSTEESRRKAGLKIRGENHPGWIKDRSKLKRTRHDSSERDRMFSWRRDIYEKFDYTCQKTGVKGGRLTAHHIYNWADYPELRYRLDNGIALSREAHKEYHSIYGVRNNTAQQLNEFLGGK